MENLNLGDIDGRMLIFGGPYSNLAATRAMQETARQLDIPPERIICTGDLVAYCAEPVETVDLIRDWGIPVVMGNCEESLADSSEDCGCGFDEGSACSLLSVTWFDYANARIRPDQRKWMSALPRTIDFQFAGFNCRVIHAALNSINQFVFESDSLDDKADQVRQAQVDIIIGGHSGIPFGQKLDTGYWLNAGVIGMPANEGRSDVWYMLLETELNKATASWHRLDYGAEQSARTTQSAGMTEYGQALVDGLWPSMDVLPQRERSQQGRQLQPESLEL